jgi:tetratricopeptide (TPR) repeat protein
MRRRTNCSGLELPPLPISIAGREEPPAALGRGDPLRGRFYTDFARSLQKMQNWNSALEVYLLALTVDPKAVAAYGGVGLICQELGTAEIGKAFLQRGIEIDPSAAEMHYYLASVEEALGAPRQALEGYRAAVRLHEPNVPPRYLVRLGLLQLSEGADKDAEVTLIRALKQDPSFALTHYALGKLHLKRRDYLGAERSLAKALQLDPLMQEAWYAYGLACVRSGKQDKGREVLESYQRKKALRAGAVGGMSRELPPQGRVTPLQ